MLQKVSNVGNIVVYTFSLLHITVRGKKYIKAGTCVTAS